MNRQQMLSNVLLVGLVAAYWLFLGSGNLSQISEVKGEIRALRETLNSCAGDMEQLEAAQAQVGDVSAWLERVQALYAIEGHAPDLLLEIATTMDDCGLGPQDTSPGSIRRREPLTEQKIRVVVHGELTALFEFLRRMEASHPFCRIIELRVEHSTTSGGIRADLTILRLWRRA